MMKKIGEFCKSEFFAGSMFSVFTMFAVETFREGSYFSGVVFTFLMAVAFLFGYKNGKV